MLRDVNEFTSLQVTKSEASTPLNITACCSSNISYPYTHPLVQKRDTSQVKNKHFHYQKLASTIIKTCNKH